MFLLRHQKQKYKDNCGPTCVAILASKTQFLAIRSMFRQNRTKWCLSWYPDICRGLDALGVEYGKPDKPVSRWENIRAISIVSVDDDKHWVIYSPKEGKRGWSTTL